MESDKTTHTSLSERRGSPRKDIEFFLKLGSGFLERMDYIDTAALDSVKKALDEQRKKMFERFPSDLEGLNVDRINNFFESYDLSVPPVIVLAKEQYDDFDQYMEDNFGAKMDSEAYASYLPHLDLVCVKRNRDIEVENKGAEFTESIIVHELAHGSTMIGGQVAVIDADNNTKINSFRSGHIVQVLRHEEGGTGHFLEEAFAERMRGKYFESIGMKTGVSRRDEDEYSLTTIRDITVEVPPKYSFKSKGNDCIVASSFAAAALELLMEKDPDLWPAFLSARKDVEGLREVAKRLNAIQPGLYKTLRDDYPYTSQGFFDGLHYVDNIVKMADQSQPATK